MPGTRRGLWGWVALADSPFTVPPVDGGARVDAEVGQELVVDLGPVFQVEAVTDRLVADVAGHRDVVRPVQDEPAGHRVPHRGVDDERVELRLAGMVGLPRVVEVGRVVGDPAALAELVELDALDLDRLVPLAETVCPPK